MLSQDYRKFKITLKRIEGRVEFGVTAYCNLDSPTTELARTSQRLEALRKRIATATPGRAYFLKQELKDLIMAEARRQAQSLVRKIFPKLRKISDDGVLNKPFSKEATQDKSTMVLNAAYLVGRDSIGVFKVQFQKIKKHYGKHGVELRLSGP